MDKKTLSRDGTPIAWPTVPVYRPDAGTFLITTSIALPQKAYNIRRDPRVALLFSDPIGSGLSDAEKRKGLEAEYKALEYNTSGQKVTWKGDNASHYGEVVAAQPYRVGSQDCRQYTHTVFTGGAGVTARGTACRNADGSWTPLT